MNKERENDNCRESSKRQWLSKGTNEDINSGSFQRMADALEQTNRNNQELINKMLSIEKFYLSKLKTMDAKLSHMKRRILILENNQTNSINP